MSLAKFAAQYGPEALKWLQANKKGLGIGAAGVGAAGLGAVAAEPYIDDFMTDQALGSVGRNLKRGLVDALEFAEEHPYVTAAALGGAGMLGGAMGQEGFAGLLDTVSPVKISHLISGSQPRNRRGR